MHIFDAFALLADSVPQLKFPYRTN